jgi:hypothetical protein
MVHSADVDYEARAEFGPSPGPLFADAAALLACELLDRWPRSTGDSDSALWWSSLLALGRAVHRFTLWREMAQGRSGAMLAKAGTRILNNRPDLFFKPRIAAYLMRQKADFHEGLAVSFMLLAGASDPRLHYEIKRMIENPSSDPGPWFLASAAGETDRFEDLGRWPLPRELHALMRLPGEDMSLADFLCFATAAPLSVAQWKPEVAGLLLFAAAHLNAEQIQRWNFLGATRIEQAWRRDLARRALTWLAGQFPQRAFPKQLEAMIGQAPELRYA